MIQWNEFEDKIKENPYIIIDNNSSKNIVLFGNCHIATIGYILNELLNNKYNVYIIISWYCDKMGVTNFNMENINNNISKIIHNCDIFLFQKHIKDYGVNASCIEKFVNNKTKVLQIPNLRLVFDTLDKNIFVRSLEILEYNIQHSDFPDLQCIVDNIYKIQFFNIPEHPTHYILFLITKFIIRKIFIPEYIPFNINDYYSLQNRNQFKKLVNYVILPGKKQITSEISNVTGIYTNPEYFD